MGLFNSVYVKCPDCEMEQEVQFKPGDMDSWVFPQDEDIPIDYLERLDGVNFDCRKCGLTFHTRVDVEIKISNKRVVKGSV